MLSSINKTYYFLVFILINACQKPASIGSELDNLSGSELPPMGSITYNDELKKQIEVLDDILDKPLSFDLKSRLKLLVNNKSSSSIHKDYDNNILKVIKLLPELLDDKKNYNEIEKIFLKSKLYFINRRFVESAIGMTHVLKRDPLFFEAINLRARSIFFLGNLHLAVMELEKIIKEAGENSEYGLDALYLIGAMIYESNQEDDVWLKKAIWAWNTYLIHVANTGLAEDVKNSLKDLSSRLDQKYQDDKYPNYSNDKNNILKAFTRDELLLALKLAEDFLKKDYDPDVAIIKARIMFKNGRHEEAKLLFDNIIKKFPSYAPGFHYLGMSYMMRGQPQQAIESWQKVIELDPKYASKHGLAKRIAVANNMLKKNY